MDIILSVDHKICQWQVCVMIKTVLRPINDWSGPIRRPIPDSYVNKFGNQFGILLRRTQFNYDLEAMIMKKVD